MKIKPFFINLILFIFLILFLNCGNEKKSDNLSPTKKENKFQKETAIAVEKQSSVSKSDEILIKNIKVHFRDKTFVFTYDDIISGKIIEIENTQIINEIQDDKLIIYWNDIAKNKRKKITAIYPGKIKHTSYYSVSNEFGIANIEILIEQDEIGEALKNYINSIRERFTNIEYSAGELYCDGIVVSDGYLVYLSESKNSLLFIKPKNYSYQAFLSSYDNSIYKPVLKENESEYIGAMSLNKKHQFYEAKDKSCIVYIKGNKLPNELISPLNNIDKLYPRYTKKATSKNISNSERLQFIMGEKYGLNTKRKYFSDILSNKISPIKEIVIKMPTELVIIRKEQLPIITLDTILFFDKHNVLLQINDDYLTIIVKDSFEDKIMTAVKTKVFTDDNFNLSTNSILLKSYIENDLPIKVTVVNMAFYNEFQEGYYTLHSYENKIAWRIRRKYYPIKVEVPGIKNIDWKISDNYYEKMGNVLPHYFPADKYYNREEIFGPPPKKTADKNITDKANGPIFYVKYAWTPLGYNRAQKDIHRYCRKDKTIVFIDKIHKKKKFRCPVCGNILH